MKAPENLTDQEKQQGYRVEEITHFNGKKQTYYFCTSCQYDSDTLEEVVNGKPKGIVPHVRNGNHPWGFEQ